MHIMVLFFIFAIIAASLCSICIWSPKKISVKIFAVVLGVLLMTISYVSISELLSKPKPVAMEWFQRDMKEATVLSARIQENVAIYIWIQAADNPEPRYYKISWDIEVAKQLQQAMKEAEKNQGGLTMKLPFEKSWDTDKPKFYALPQPKLPEKNGEGDSEKGPMMYKHPGTSA